MDDQFPEGMTSIRVGWVHSPTSQHSQPAPLGALTRQWALACRWCSTGTKHSMDAGRFTLLSWRCGFKMVRLTTQIDYCILLGYGWVCFMMVFPAMFAYTGTLWSLSASISCRFTASTTKYQFRSRTSNQHHGQAFVVNASVCAMFGALLG